MSVFQFKKFHIQQAHAAMKIGTDSILLGAWAQPLPNTQSILDIGAGTGVLSLMLAQRCEAETIDAVEIEPQAYEEAVTNFENSHWADRLFCYHTSIQEFADKMDETYDFIIANPPYFSPHNIQSINAKSVARQTHLLNHITLLKNTQKLLSKQGICAFILPCEMGDFFINLAQNMGFFPLRICRVKDTENAPAKRVLLELSFVKKKVQESELVLKNNDKTYSDAFIELTQDFYTIF